MEIYCGIANKEIYPFSLFPMYRKTMSGENHFQCSVFIIPKNSNQQIPYRKVGKNDIEYLFSFNICKNEQKAIELSQHPADLERIVKEYLSGIKKSKLEKIDKIIIKAQFWNKFELSNIDHPDRDIIIYEKNI